jgi:hypothetical protein
VVKPVVPAVMPTGAAGGPAIASPHSNQVFTAPASFKAAIAGKSRERLVFTVKSVSGGSFRLQSQDGRFTGIPAGDYCVEAAFLKTPSSTGPCVPFRVTAAAAPALQAKALPQAAPPSAPRPATVAPAVPAIPAPAPAIPAAAPAAVSLPAAPQVPAVAMTAQAVSPAGTVVTEGKRVFLNLNVAVARADVYAGANRLGQLPGGTRLEITSYVPKALRGELIFHYFDARGGKTVQKVQVGSGRK